MLARIVALFAVEPGAHDDPLVPAGGGPHGH
jgi:hypothetical protein